MKKLLLMTLMPLLLFGCKKDSPSASTGGSQGGGTTSSSWPYVGTTGTFAITPNPGSIYTVSGLTVSTKAVQNSASASTYISHTFRGKNNTSGTSQIELFITQPNPISANGPWPINATVYTSDANYSALKLVGRASGTMSSSSTGYTATFSDPLVSGTLKQ